MAPPTPLHGVAHHRIRPRHAGTYRITAAEALRTAQLPLPPNFRLRLNGRPLPAGFLSGAARPSGGGPGSGPSRPNPGTDVGTANVCRDDPPHWGVDQTLLGLSGDLVRRALADSVPFNATLLYRGPDLFHVCGSHHRLALGREVGASLNYVWNNWGSQDPLYSLGGVGATINALDYIYRLNGPDLFEAALTLGANLDTSALPGGIRNALSFSVGLQAQVHVPRTPLAVAVSGGLILRAADSPSGGWVVTLPAVINLSVLLQSEDLWRWF
jgi:hypothetical protein